MAVSNGSEGSGYHPTGEPLPKDYPFIIAFMGPHASGKDALLGKLIRISEAKGGPRLKQILTFKEREQRTGENPIPAKDISQIPEYLRRGMQIDYIRVSSQEEYDSLINQGIISVPYQHSGNRYGIPGTFVDVLTDDGTNPMFVIDRDGLNALTTYVVSKGLGNRILPFLIYASPAELESRLVGRYKDSENFHEMYRYIGKSREQFNMYRSSGDSTRHQFHNRAINGLNPEQSLSHTVNRILDVLNLETRIGDKDAWGFREAYVNAVISKLFGGSAVNYKELLEGGDDLRIEIPEDVVARYAEDKNIDRNTFGMMQKRKVIGTVNSYGIISVLFEPFYDAAEKKIFLDLIRKTVGLTPESVYPEIKAAKTSDISGTVLLDSNGGFLDPYLAFRSYDPIKPPEEFESRPHALVLDGIIHTDKPRIRPMDHGRFCQLFDYN